MAAELFTVDVDTKPAEQNLSRFADWVVEGLKKIEDAGAGVDKTFEKIGKDDPFANLKRYINEIIREINKIDAMPEGMVKSGYGTVYQNRIKELTAAREQLRLKIEEQGKAEEAVAEKSETVLDGLIKTVGRVVGAWLTWKTVMEIGQKILESTSRTSLEFEKAIEGAKAGIQAFFKAVASGDTDDLVQKMRKASDAAKEYVDQMDYINDLTMQYGLEELAIQKRIWEQKEIVNSGEETSYEEKVAAQKTLMSLMQMKADLEIDLASKTFNAVADRTAGMIRLTKEEILYAMQNVNALNGMSEAYRLANSAGKEYVETVLAFNRASAEERGEISMKLAVMEGIMRVQGQSQEQIEKRRDTITKIYREENTQLIELAMQYDNLSDAEKKEFNQAAMKYAQTLVSAEREQAVAERRLSMLERQATAAAEAAAKEVEDAKKKASDLDNILAQETAAYIKAKQNRDVVGAEKHLNEIRRITQEQMALSGLTQELNDQLEATKELAEYQEKMRRGPDKVSIDHLSATAELTKEIVKLNKDDLIPAKTHIADLDLKSLESLKDQYFQYLDLVGATEQQVNGVKALFNIVDSLKKNYESILNIVSVIKEGDDSLEGANVQDVTNLMGLAMTMINGVMSVLPDKTKHFGDEVERLNILLAEQQRILDLSSTLGNQEQAMRDYIDLLNQQAEAANRAAFNYARAGKGDEATKMIEQFNQVQIAIEDATIALENFLRGGITTNVIADAITEGFASGKTSVDDFASYMNDILRDALMNVFAEKVLMEVAGSNIMAAIDSAFENGSISVGEAENLQKMMAELGATLAPLYESMMAGIEYVDEITQNNIAATEASNAVAQEAAAAAAAEESMYNFQAVYDAKQAALGELTNQQAETAAVIAESQASVAATTGLVDQINQQAVATQGIVAEVQANMVENQQQAVDLTVILNQIAGFTSASSEYNRIAVDRLVGIEQNTYNTVEGIRIMIGALNTVAARTYSAAYM